MIRQNFIKKELPRQNLQKNLYPQMSGKSRKNIWSSKQNNSQNTKNIFESYQKTQSRGLIMHSGSLSQNDQNSFNTNLVENLKRKLNRQSRKASFETSLKHKSKGKLYSMRKQAKISQLASEKQRNLQQDSNNINCQIIDPNMLSMNDLKNHMLRQNTKLHFEKAKLSKEDFNLQNRKPNNLYINNQNKPSKKSFLENKIGFKTRYYNNEISNNQSRRQNSIFEETQAKFERNLSSSRASELLHKIVSKDKSPLSSRGIKISQKKFKKSFPHKNESQKKFYKVKRTKTKEYTDGSNLKSKINPYKKRRQQFKNDSLNLSDSVGFHPNKENQVDSRNYNKFYYKKSLKKNVYNQEVLF